LNSPVTSENLDARIKYVQNVTRYACEQKWLDRKGAPYRMRGQSDQNFLTMVTKVGLLTDNELTTHGLSAFEGIGRKDEKGYAKAAFANWLQGRKEFEKAAEVWRSMVSIPPDAKKVPRNEANYVLGLSNCLKNLKQYDEALSTLNKLEGKEFDPSLKASYDQYRRDIETAKSNKGDTAKPEVKKSTGYRPHRSDRISPNLTTLPPMVAV
jgi:tetratricopeptide (TPR) repeat protein